MPWCFPASSYARGHLDLSPAALHTPTILAHTHSLNNGPRPTACTKCIVTLLMHCLCHRQHGDVRRLVGWLVGWLVDAHSASVVCVPGLCVCVCCVTLMFVCALCVCALCTLCIVRCVCVRVRCCWCVLCSCTGMCVLCVHVCVLNRRRDIHNWRKDGQVPPAQLHV